VWCEDCRHQVDDDPADQVDRYGAETTVQLARSARLQSVRRPQGRHGGDRNRVLCFSADRDPLLLRSSRRSPRRLIGRSQATSPDCGHRKNTGLQPRSGWRKAVALLVSMGKSISSGSFDPHSVFSQDQARDEYPRGKFCAISVEI
jgi:hypothetical protein